MRRLSLLAIVVATIVAIALPGISPHQAAHAVGADPLFFRGEPEDNWWNFTLSFCTDGFIIDAAQQFQQAGTPGQFLSTDHRPFSAQLTASDPPVRALGPIASSDGSNDATNTPIHHAATFLWSTAQTVTTPISITTERWDHGYTGSPDAVLADATADQADKSDFDDVTIFTYSSSDSDQQAPWYTAPDGTEITARVLGSPSAAVSNCSVLPTTTATAAPAPSANGWNNSAVSVQLQPAAATAGVFPIATTYYAVDNAACAPGAVASCSTYSGPFTVANDGRHVVSFFSVDAGGNAGARKSIPINVDRTAPTIAITAPTTTTYTLNQAVTADYTCSDGGSGVATCAGPVASGGQIDTASLGAKTFTVNATDNAGNTASQSISYTVVANAQPTATATPAPPSATSTPTAPYGPAPSPTGTSTPLSTNQPLVTTGYFAEGYTGQASTNGRASFSEVLDILNPGASAAQATITYYIQGNSAPLVFTRAVPPHSMLRESVNEDAGNDKLVAAVVTSPQLLAVTRTISRISANGARLDSSTTRPATAPGTSWAFPEGYTGVTFQEYLTILNPSGTVAHVTITLAPQAASAAGARVLNLTVPPLSRATANIRSLNLRGTAKSVGMLISSDQPIVPERVLYFGEGGGSGKFGSTVTIGTTSPAGRLYLAYGSAGGSAGGTRPIGDQDFITLLNPASSGAVQVTATFFDRAGHAIARSQPVTVAAGTRRTIIANNVLGARAVPVFSAVLDATGPIVAEAAQYFRGSPNAGAHPGVDFPALAQGARRVYLAGLATRLPDGAAVNQSVFLYNPGTSPIHVAATYFGAAGATSRGAYTIPARGITLIHANQEAGASIPAGAMGAEYAVAPGESGGIIAYATGHTGDGRSASEDVGVTLP